LNGKERKDTSLRHMLDAADERTVILSPHLDDAVVSCWHVLTRGAQALVANVFAGVPEQSHPPTIADRLAGFGKSADLVRVRLQEDRAALSLVDCESTYLGFIEDQYRTTPVSAAEIQRSLAPHVDGASRVLAPAGIGGHPDHKLMRDVGLGLLKDGLSVELYGDIPYVVRYGWPSWMIGAEPEPHLVVDAYWDAFLSDVRGQGYRLTVRQHDLGDEGSREKLIAMEMYATQFQQLNSGIVDRLRNPLILRYEVSWEVR
jgi:LmbE family N-acetylglucosaminyl deacetylase